MGEAPFLCLRESFVQSLFNQEEPQWVQSWLPFLAALGQGGSTTNHELDNGLRRKLMCTLYLYNVAARFSWLVFGPCPYFFLVPLPP